MVSLPRPEPWTEERSARLPPPPAISTGRELDLDLDQSDAPPPALLLRCFVLNFVLKFKFNKCCIIIEYLSLVVLLSNHLVRWWGVRKAWKQAAVDNEKRFQSF